MRHSLYGWISLLEVLGKNRTRERKAFFNILAPYHGKNHVVFVKIVLVWLLLSKGNDGEGKLKQIRRRVSLGFMPGFEILSEV